jgi:hypothetical protein
MNVTGSFYALLNIFNKPKILIYLHECVLWFNIFPYIAHVPQYDSVAGSYGL